jgi:hypothetical protein
MLIHLDTRRADFIGYLNNRLRKKVNSTKESLPRPGDFKILKIS